jgi:hypothetical protein
MNVLISNIFKQSDLSRTLLFGFVSGVTTLMLVDGYESHPHNSLMLYGQRNETNISHGSHI